MEMHFVNSSGASTRGRTKLAWALAELNAKPACMSPSDHAVLRVIELALPAGTRAYSSSLQFEPPNSDHVFAAMLPLATNCWVTSVGATPQRRQLPIASLHGARVQSDGRVELPDGTAVHEVEIIPSRQPHPNDLEWAILGALIEARGLKHQFTRVFPLPPDVADQCSELAEVRWIDVSRLHSLEPRLLKQDRFDIKHIAPWLKFSEEKLAQTLAKFGVRVRRPRQRVRSAPTTNSP
jgi:hypothetical protein